MVDFNKSWAKNAAVLVVVISRKNFEHNGKPSVTHQFDAGLLGKIWHYKAKLKDW
jgi:hypothetical protein